MNSKLLIFASLFVIGLLPILSFAADPLVYKPLVGIPNLNNSTSFSDYINALYGLAIAIAALMAVIKIIIAGVKYMLSDVVTSKQEAISDIRGSLLGLLVVISAVLVLSIINPQLTKSDVFIDQVTLPSNTGGATATPETPKTGNGYSYVTAGANKDFQANCDESTGYKYKVVIDGGKSYQVCYAPLDSGLINELNNTFKPPINLTNIVNRYQTAHRPRLITDSTKLNSIAVTHNSTLKNAASPYGVFLAVTYIDNPPTNLDWIDRANFNSINTTCGQFAQVTNLKVQRVKGVDYLACVSVP